MDSDVIELIERLNSLVKDYICKDRKLNIAIQALIEIDNDKTRETLKKIMEVK